jgi:hypothetical protein
MEVSIICNLLSWALVIASMRWSTCFAPLNKAIVAGRAWAVPLWQIAPWRTGSQHQEDAVQHAAVIHARHATGFVGEKRFDHAPFGVSRVISAHASHESDFAVT